MTLKEVVSDFLIFLSSFIGKSEGINRNGQIVGPFVIAI